MLVTINTDASFHKWHKVGAFAFWAVSDQFRIQKAGYFRDPCKRPTECETKCIINAFKVVLAANAQITKIIVNTDSLNSIWILENNRKLIKKYDLYFGKSLRRLFKKIVKDYDISLTIEFRHVKAHSGKDDARSYVNEWCDTNAKIYLWKRINELKSKNGKK